MGNLAEKSSLQLNMVSRVFREFFFLTVAQLRERAQEI